LDIRALSILRQRNHYVTIDRKIFPEKSVSTLANPNMGDGTAEEVEIKSWQFSIKFTSLFNYSFKRITEATTESSSYPFTRLPQERRRSDASQVP
jgi:hypothetical protein